MEAVVTTSLLAGRSQYERSCLPTLAQLNLHVDGADLLRRLEARPMTGDQLEQLAQANHQVYCDDLRARGYRYGPKTDNALQEREALVSWAELPEGLKQQDREAVADIESKLQTIGAMIVRSTGNEPPFQFADAEIDRLSRDEHLRWYKSKLADGWRYGPERDNDNLVHPAPLPWPVGEAAVQYTTDELGRIGTSYPSTRRRRTAPRCAASPRSSTGPATRSSAARSERRPPPRGQPAMLTPNSLPMP